MKKYLVIDEPKNGMGDVMVKVFDDVETARKEANAAWAYLTTSERKKRIITVADVTEEDLADYAIEDGNIDWTCYENCGHEVCEVIGKC